MKILISNKYLHFGLVLIGGVFLGWIFFHTSGVKEVKKEYPEEIAKATIWTCAMHPQIKMPEPGKCPICGMDLIPLNQNSTSEMDFMAVHLTKEAAELANVMTSIVSIQKPVKEVRLYGKVQADERLLQSQVAPISGRVEKLFVDFTGESVQKGQKLALIYSPELLTAQQELLEAARTKQSQPEIYEASKERLRQWKLAEGQISAIENSGNIQSNVEIFSNTNGIVTSKRVNNGDYVSQGSVLYEVSDLSKVWVLFDAYESDLQFLKTGDRLEFTVQSLPGTNFTSSILFIDPVIDAINRVAKVRVEVINPNGKLKPEMFATGIVKSKLEGYNSKMVIPRSAVLWTGKRSVVYVKQADIEEAVFKMHEVELGPMLGDSYIIMDGLTEGEEIVTQGAFSVDASAQLEGKPSMMNPDGGKTTSMPGMVMPGDPKPDIGQSIPGDTKLNKDVKNKPAGNNSAEEVVKIDVSMDFTMQLNKAFDQYIVLKEAFVQSNAMKAKQAAQELQQALSNVDMKMLAGDTHGQWMDILGNMELKIKLITSSDKIEDQRVAFSILSDHLCKAIKTFGLMGKTVYYQFCPMANNGRGAYWLSETKDIRNPYYGEKMIDCGETKETLNF